MQGITADSIRKGREDIEREIRESAAAAERDEPNERLDEEAADA